MKNHKKTINVIGYTRIATAAMKVKGNKMMSFFGTDNEWLPYKLCLHDTICDIYLGKVLSERHDLIV